MVCQKTVAIGINQPVAFFSVCDQMRPPKWFFFCNQAWQSEWSRQNRQSNMYLHTKSIYFQRAPFSDDFCVFILRVRSLLLCFLHWCFPTLTYSSFFFNFRWLLLSSLFSASFVAIYRVGRLVCSLETLLNLATPRLFVWENSWDLIVFLISPQWGFPFTYKCLRHLIRLELEMGRTQFPLAAKSFLISKPLLSCSGTNPRVFQVFYVHTQAERTGGGLMCNMCIQTLQHSSRSVLCNAHMAAPWRGSTRQVQMKKLRLCTRLQGIEAHQISELLQLMDVNGASSTHSEEGASCQVSWTVLIWYLIQSPARLPLKCHMLPTWPPSFARVHISHSSCGHVYGSSVTLALNKQPRHWAGPSTWIHYLPSQVKKGFLSLSGKYVICTTWNSLRGLRSQNCLISDYMNREHLQNSTSFLRYFI